MFLCVFEMCCSEFVHVFLFVSHCVFVNLSLGLCICGLCFLDFVLLVRGTVSFVFWVGLDARAPPCLGWVCLPAQSPKAADHTHCAFELRGVKLLNPNGHQTSRRNSNKTTPEKPKRPFLVVQGLRKPPRFH